MKKKKGFVFVETLIVVAVLTTALLLLYSTYSSVIYKEKTRIKYNDSVYLYRTYYLGKFLRNFRLDNVVDELEDPKRNEKYELLFTTIGCNSNKIDLGKDQGVCEALVNDLNIQMILLSKNDLSSLTDCKDQKGVCEQLIMNDTVVAASDFIKTIGGKGTSGYRLIVIYALKKDGGSCKDEPDTCEYYYATLSMGELI